VFERLTQQQRCPTCNRPVHCETTRGHARELCLYEGVLGRVPESFKSKDLQQHYRDGLRKKNCQFVVAQKMRQNPVSYRHVLRP
jgi:hypothetical protein